MSRNREQGGNGFVLQWEVLTVSKLQYGRMLSPRFVSPLQSSSCRRYSLELTKQWLSESVLGKPGVERGDDTH